MTRRVRARDAGLHHLSCYDGTRQIGLIHERAAGAMPGLGPTKAILASS